MLKRLVFLIAILPSALFAAGLPTCFSTYFYATEHPPTSYEFFRIFYGKADPIPLGKSIEADNAAYLSMIGQPGNERLLYFHGMLKVLKEVNEKIFTGEGLGGREDANAARNLFRVLLAENMEKNPKLARALKGRFIDFKTFELAMDPKEYESHERLIAEMNGALVETQIQFSHIMSMYMQLNPTLRESLITQRGLVSETRAWHLTGVSPVHPDLAVIMARLAVANYKPDKVMSSNARSFDEEAVLGALQRVEEKTKATLQGSLPADTKLFVPYEGTAHRVLSPDAIDVLRKVPVEGSDGYYAFVGGELEKRGFGKLSETQVFLLRDYYAQSDLFQPTIRVAQRTQIDTKNATKGLLNIDFAGQNVVNLYHTMGAIAEANARRKRGDGNPALELVRLTRAGEKLATDRLLALQAHVDQARKEAGIAGEYQTSGDDGSVVLVGTPSFEQREAFYRALVARKAPISDFRIVWVPPMRKNGVLDKAEMSKESLKGEDFEKRLRGHLYGKIPLAELKGLMFPLQIDPVTQTLHVTVVGARSPGSERQINSALGQPSLHPKGYTVGSVRWIP